MRKNIKVLRFYPTFSIASTAKPFSPSKVTERSFSLSETRRVQSNPGELGQASRTAMVRDSGSKHENSRTSGRPSGELAGRSGGCVPGQLARNWFQLGG